MKEYLEFRLALTEVMAAGYAVGLASNPKAGDWRATLAFPGVNAKPWTARGATMEAAFMAAVEQMKSGTHNAHKDSV